MNDTARSIVTAAGVLASVGAVCGGLTWREHVDSAGTVSGVSTYRADRSNTESINEMDFYRQMSLLLKREYVDPINDDQKLASGAVRGMIGSLGDLYSMYMDKTQFAVFKSAQNGSYEGIGVVLSFRTPGVNIVDRTGLTPESDESDAASQTMPFPKIVVSDVIPGGPADKAGVKVGDTVSSVNGHWIIDGKQIQAFREVQRKFSKQLISREEYAKAHRDIRIKIDSSLLAGRARDRLVAGTSGEIDVVWERKGQQLTTKLIKSVTKLATFRAAGSNVQRLAFQAGNEDELRTAVQGKAELTIDLRHNVRGDFEVMRKCLADLAPAGSYGYIDNYRDGKAKPFKIGQGPTKTPKLKLLVDGSTSGAAQVFASILQKRGAVVVGTGMVSDPIVVQVKTLPDGGGYTLATGKYTSTAPKAALTAHKPHKWAVRYGFGRKSQVVA